MGRMVMADVAGKQNSLKKKGKNKQKKKTNQVVKEAGKSSQEGGKENSAEDKSFNVEDVLYFGGEKEDFEKLLNVDAEEELVTDGVEDETEKLRKEIENFLQGGGFEELDDENFSEEQMTKKSAKLKEKKEKSG